jgi:hypothetical protein
MIQWAFLHPEKIDFMITMYCCILGVSLYQTPNTVGIDYGYLEHLILNFSVLFDRKLSKNLDYMKQWDSNL